MNDVAQTPGELVAGPAKWFRIYAYVALVFAAIGLLGSIGYFVVDAEASGGVVGLAVNLFSVVLSGGVAFMTLKAADSLERLENWTYVLIFAILAIIPCTSGCCLMGIPIGIWVLVAINKAEVKEAFTS